MHSDDDPPANMSPARYRFLGLSVPITIASTIPPEFDQPAIEQVQQEHHAALLHWGAAGAGTVIVSVRTSPSKAAHTLRTTLVPQHADHYHHLLARAVQAWASKNQGALEATGPSFDHSHYGAVIGRGGQNIRSCSPAAKLVWDAANPLAGYYVVCVPEATDQTAAWGHQLRARLDHNTGLQVGLPTTHPFGIDRPPAGELFDDDNVVVFGVDCGSPDALQAPLNAAFAAHTEQLAREAPRMNRGHWLLDAPVRARIIPPFESSVIAAEWADGTLKIALARRNWQQCQALVEHELRRAGIEYKSH